MRPAEEFSEPSGSGRSALALLAANCRRRDSTSSTRLIAPDRGIVLVSARAAPKAIIRCLQAALAPSLWPEGDRPPDVVTVDTLIDFMADTRVQEVCAQAAMTSACSRHAEIFAAQAGWFRDLASSFSAPM